MLHNSKVITLCAVVALLGANAWAAQPAHEHGHEAATLQLNEGKKWPTDAPLRKGMENIRKAVFQSMDAIHHDRLGTPAYEALAGRVERETGAIVANCRLEPAADAQLHLVLARLGAGTEAMKAGAATARRQGAIQVVQALDTYARHFDHPGWERPAH